MAEIKCPGELPDSAEEPCLCPQTLLCALPPDPGAQRRWSQECCPFSWRKGTREGSDPLPPALHMAEGAAGGTKLLPRRQPLSPGGSRRLPKRKMVGAHRTRGTRITASWTQEARSLRTESLFSALPSLMQAIFLNCRLKTTLQQGSCLPLLSLPSVGLHRDGGIGCD